MSRRVSCALMAALLPLAGASTASGQFVSLVTDFENPSWEFFVTEVMFNDPSFSGTTRGLDGDAGDNTYLTDVGSDIFSVARSGTRSSASFWGWLDASHHTSWVRLATTNTEELPNPAVHLEGTVKFWASAKGYTDATFATEVTTGNLFVGIGIRETGQGVHLGGDGGIGGDIEWVGLDAKLIEVLAGTNGLCDTTANPESDDTQLIPAGQPGGPDDACVDAGLDGILDTAAEGDDGVMTTPRGMFSLPSDGVMREYVFDLPALETSGSVFAFTGDASLAATPNNRGALEHVVLTNDPLNGPAGAAVFLVNIDDVEFSAPILDPPSIITLPEPPRPLEQEVAVEFIHPDADLVQILKLMPDGSDPVLLGEVDPDGDTSLGVPTAPLASGIRIVAVQTVGPDTSDQSTPAVVASAGTGPLRIAMAVRETDAFDHDLTCGEDGTGFDPDQAAPLEFVGASGTDGFGVPIGRRFVPQADWFEITFDPCDEEFGLTVFSGDPGLVLNPEPDFTNGVWEGLYFRIDEFSPTTGPFTVFIDDMVVVNGAGPGVDCVVDDFESYTPGDFIVGDGGPDAGGNGVADTVAEATDVQVVAPGAAVFPGQIIVSAGADGTLETEADGDDFLSHTHARFNAPLVAGTSVGMAPEPNVSMVTNEDAFSGTQSLKIEWSFTEASNDRSLLRLTSNGSLAEDPPETFFNPDSVVALSTDGTFCDGESDILYSVMVKLAPPEVPGDSDRDGDVDLVDYGNFQACIGANPIPDECLVYDLFPIGEPDGVIDLLDYELLSFLFIGPGA